jgi:hypothetical protein
MSASSTARCYAVRAAEQFVQSGPLARIEVARVAARVEPELVCSPADRPTRKNTVERRIGRERPVKERVVRARLAGRDERLRTPHSSQESGIDGRRRREARPWHAPDQRQLVPRSPAAAEQRRGPDRGPLGGKPPLDDRVHARERHAWVVEQRAQDRGPGGEGEVGDDRERLTRQRKGRRICLVHLHPGIAGKAAAEAGRRGRVELDGEHAGSRVGERAGEDATASAEIEHEGAGLDARRAYEICREGVTTQVVTRARRTRALHASLCHGKPPSSSRESYFTAH